MNYISANKSHYVLPVSMCNTSISLNDSNSSMPKKLSSLRVLQGLPDLMLMKPSCNHMDDTKENKAPKSFCSLDHLIREAEKVSSSGALVACSSTSKLNHQWNPAEKQNVSMKNAVFDVQASSRRRRPLRARRGFVSKQMRKELLLDDSGSLRRRMEEYRRQMKTKTFIPAFDTDSDAEDFE